MNNQTMKNLLQSSKLCQSRPHLKQNDLSQVQFKTLQVQKSQKLIKSSQNIQAEQNKHLQNNKQTKFNAQNPQNIKNKKPKNSLGKYSKDIFYTKKDDQNSQKVNYKNEEVKSQLSYQDFFSSKKKYNKLEFITNSIFKTIQQGKIQINPQKIQIELKKQQISPQKNWRNLLNQEQIRLKQIAQKKQKMIEQINKLYDQQKQVRNRKKQFILQNKCQNEFIIRNKNELISKQPTQKQKVGRSYSSKLLLTQNHLSRNTTGRQKRYLSYQKSYFTSQEKKQILSIIKRKALKQKFYQEKDKQFIQKLELQHKKTIKIQKDIIQAQKQKRRLKVLQRFKTQKTLKTQFLKQNKQKYRFKTESLQGELKDNEFFTSPQCSQINNKRHNQNSSKSPSKKYIYRKYEEIDMQKYKQRKQYQEILLKQRKQETKINFDEIKIHLMNYKQIKNKQIQLQRQKIQSYRTQQKNRLRQIRQKYGFLTKIKQNLIEEQKSSIEKYQKEFNKKINYQKKMKDYFHSVKQKSLSKSKSRQNSIANRVKSSLSYQENVVQDKKYHQNSSKSTSYQIQSLKNKLKSKPQFVTRKRQSIASNLSANIIMQPNSKRYHNYLTQKTNWHDKSVQRRQNAIMKLLKSQDSSFQQIKQALQAFNLLNNTDKKPPCSNIKTKQIKSQADLLKERN